MLNAIAKELRSRKLITPRQPFLRPDEPYIAPRLRWP
jgi:hypothetical protein